MNERKTPPTLEESLRRMFDAVERADRRISQMLTPPVTPPPRPEIPRAGTPMHGQHTPWELIREQISYKLERRRIRELERLERERRRAERKLARRRQREQPNPVAGVVMLAIAGVLAYLAATGQPFWLLFVALALAMGGASQFKRAPQLTEGEEPASSKRDATASTQIPGLEDDKRHVDEVARQLLKELKEGPSILREIVARPEQTVEGLRSGYHALASREQKLRELIRAEDEVRLDSERAALVLKRDQSKDEVVRARYEDALRALDQQREERAAVLRAAERMEAERIRLRYSLEGLLAQVIRARSTHGIEGQANDTALRHSLERLSDEVSAVTDALESVSSIDDSRHRVR